MKPDNSVRRVLIYRLGSLGDTVMALPCFHLIEQAFPRARRILLSNFPIHAKAPAAAAVLGESGLVHGYIDYPLATRNPVELLKLALQIRRFHPDRLVYLAAPRGEKAIHRDAAFFRLCGVRRIFGLPLGQLAINRVDRLTGLMESEASRLLRCLEPLGPAALSDRHYWDLRLTSPECEMARARLRPLLGRPIVACGPGTKMQAKDWGKENWRALLSRVSSQYPAHALALVGAREDADVAQYAASGWQGPKVNLCGSLTPRETAAVLSHALVFLGPDSGPMHLAACVGTPCVVAFSARGPRGLWFPVGPAHQVFYTEVSCRACGLETCIAERRRCLSAISVDEMLNAACRTLGR